MEPVTLADMRARLQAASAAYEEAQKARYEMGEPAFSWNAAAKPRNTIPSSSKRYDLRKARVRRHGACWLSASVIS